MNEYNVYVFDKYLITYSPFLKTEIFKCHEYLHFVIKAIDYLNIQTNNALFKLHGPVNTKIN